MGLGFFLIPLGFFKKIWFDFFSRIGVGQVNKVLFGFSSKVYLIKKTRFFTSNYDYLINHYIFAILKIKGLQPQVAKI